MPRSFEEILMTTACIVFLPVCILDQEASGPQGLTRADLAANGYSQSEISSIIQGQEAFLSHLKANQLQVTSEGPMSKADLVGYIQSVEGVTADYVQFVKEN